MTAPIQPAIPGANTSFGGNLTILSSSFGACLDESNGDIFVTRIDMCRVQCVGMQSTGNNSSDQYLPVIILHQTQVR